MLHPLPLDQLSGLLHAGDPVLLLDSALPVTENRCSYLFLDPRQVLVAERHDQLAALWEQLDKLSKRFWIAGYLAYEAAYAMEPCLAPLQTDAQQGWPLAWFMVCEQPLVFDHLSGAWNEPFPMAESDRRGQAANGPVRYTPAIDERTYHRKLATIFRLLGAGETYQINFTFDGTVDCDALSDLDLYRQLRAEQRVPYAAFIRHGGTCIQSFSPELLFRLSSAGTITVKPMKGTAQRGRTVEVDRRARQYLAADAKNRAENLMIVDLLRNDLGKICEIGSVEVRELFAVECHRTLLQMTSTVQGRLRPEVTPSGILRALFPSGSVTGAPKVRSMEIIAGLEQGRRGPYCGTIGYLSPSGEAVFSVPIRTLVRGVGEERRRFRVGSGVVWESEPAEEWRECLTKAAFLTSHGGPFEIVETMLLENGELAFALEHRRRMAASAGFWGYPFTAERWQEVVAEVIAENAGDGSFLVRILLDEYGGMRRQVTPIAADPWGARPAPVTIGRRRVAADNPFLYHKTTHRPWYREAMQAIRDGEIFDQLFIDDHGELCEGAKSNIFVQVGEEDELLTPPLDAGLLPGLLRGQLLREGRCRERVLKLEDLRRARHLYCGSSVRGLVSVSLT